LLETKGVRDRVDEGADVAIPVDDGDVDGRRIHRRRHIGQIEECVHPDFADIVGGKILRQNPGNVDVDLSGIADILLAHHVGDARGFRLEMEALDAQRRKLRQIEMREDVEHD